MKSEQEIRTHVDALKRELSRPCRHQHEDDLDKFKCQQGRICMGASLSALVWALGELPEYEQMVQLVAEEER